MRSSDFGVLRVSRTLFNFALGTLAMLGIEAAWALPLSRLEGQGLDHIFGSYGPNGDCSSGPKVVIKEDGITFNARGREVRPDIIEYALTFFGQGYEGSASVFFPFPIGANDSGPVIMFVNDGERPGVIRFESDLPRGQRADPFHAEFTDAGLVRLCKSSATPRVLVPSQAVAAAVVQGVPVEWSNLVALVGRYPGSETKDNIDIFERGAVATALKARLGQKFPVLHANLSVVSPLQRAGRYFYLSGNAPHNGGIEQAYVMIDPVSEDVQVGLWERGRLTVYPPANGIRLAVPPDIRRMLDNSPPETAVPLPGTPWEVVPVQGRAPIAYVSAAASPNIEAISLYCESGKPFMAMLLNKPSAAGAMTATWNFSGRLVSIPVQRANASGTQWIGGLSGTQLIRLLTQERGTVMLRINGRQEGEASLDNAVTVLRSTMRGCAQF